MIEIMKTNINTGLKKYGSQAESNTIAITVI